VSAKPYAYVSIDGKRLEDTTPIKDLSVSAGRHRVVLQTEDGRKKEFTIDVKAGDSRFLGPVTFE
jgi:hypothetical protein